MRKVLMVLIVLIPILELRGQEVRLNAYAGNVFDDRVDSYYSYDQYFEGKIKGGFQWGAGIEFKRNKYQGFEVLYIRQSTEAPIRYYSGGVKEATFDVDLNWIMAGGNWYMSSDPKLEPYLGIMLGVASINSTNRENGNDANNTKFAYGLKGGINYWISPMLGIKLQASLLSAVQAIGGGFYFGTGGVGTGLNSYSSMMQFGLGGGLAIKISKK